MDVSIASQWTAFLVAAGGAAVTLGRIYIKVRNSNQSDSTSTAVTNQLLINLRDEIKRLEGIIAGLNERIGTLETSINGLRNLEIDGSHDFGALETISGMMPCNTCVNQGEAFVQLRDVMDRMKSRREERQKLIQKAE